VSELLNQKPVADSSETEGAVAVGVQNSEEPVPILDGDVSTRSETILLVEDEAFVREVTVQVLKSAGYVVLIAKNAAEARGLYHQFSSEVDLLLSDVVLPDENGRTLTRRLRRINALLPVLLVTGYAEQLKIKDPADVNCLAKPFTSRTLLRTVRTELDRKHWSEEGYSATRAYGIE
jgi:two-component system cell cycle sensor histidine kinase/response regulator CckA